MRRADRPGRIWAVTALVPPLAMLLALAQPAVGQAPPPPVPPIFPTAPPTSVESPQPTTVTTARPRPRAVTPRVAATTAVTSAAPTTVPSTTAATLGVLSTTSPLAEARRGDDGDPAPGWLLAFLAISVAANLFVVGRWLSRRRLSGAYS